jgi:hypothetical protein
MRGGVYLLLEVLAGPGLGFVTVVGLVLGAGLLWLWDDGGADAMRLPCGAEAEER